jgi:uncharacterized damage-inducible protein DinB
METNAIQQSVSAPFEQIVSPETLLAHWQGHRNVTRRVIEAFPEDKLFIYAIGGMRPVSELALEIMDISSDGISGFVSGEWKAISELDHAVKKSTFKTKAELLQQWDQITEQINAAWPQFTEQRFLEIELAFGAYEGRVIDLLLYFIDNEIHHRAQVYVYLRALGIEPPAFWDRS